MNKLRNAIKIEDGKIEGHDNVENSSKGQDESPKSKRRSYYEQESHSGKNSRSNLTARKSKTDLVEVIETKKEEFSISDAVKIKNEINYDDPIKSNSPILQRRRRSQTTILPMRPQSLSGVLDYDQPSPLPTVFSSYVEAKF